MSVWSRTSSSILSRGLSSAPLAGRWVFAKSSPVMYNTTRRQFSKESSATDLHSQVSQTLKATPSPPPAPALDSNAPRGVAQQIFRHPNRRARYNQAVWNAGVAFFVMLFAAQSLKASRERRRVAAELATVEKESAERLALLQVLFQDETIDKLVDELVNARQEGTPASWFGKKQSSTEAEKLRLTHVLLKTFNELVGSKALDEAQRETLSARLAEKMTPKAAAVGKVPDASVTSESSKQRVPFTM